MYQGKLNSHQHLIIREYKKAARRDKIKIVTKLVNKDNINADVVEAWNHLSDNERIVVLQEVLQ